MSMLFNLKLFSPLNGPQINFKDNLLSFIILFNPNFAFIIIIVYFYIILINFLLIWLDYLKYIIGLWQLFFLKYLRIFIGQSSSQEDKFLIF